MGVFEGSVKAPDTDEGSKLKLSEGRFNLCASNLADENEGIELL